MLDGRAQISHPGPASVLIDGIQVAAGSRVILHPRTTDTDILMRGVAGRRAIVESVLQDTEDEVRLTVTLEDDPARTLGKGRGLGHRFFFAPEELQPLPDSGSLAPPQRILIAGIGNVFMADDGFGVAVVRALAGARLPDGVDAVDFGIRGMDLAYALVDGYDAAILLDVAPLGTPPGTLEVIEPQIEEDLFVGFEAHRMDPVSVLQFARQFGSLPRRMLIVACQPELMLDPDADELLDELSPSVAAAVPGAAGLVRELVAGISERSVKDNQGAKR